MIPRIIIVLFVSICLFASCCPANAEEITLPNGQVLNIDNLNDTEITQAIRTAKKSMEGQQATQSVLSVVKDVDPTELEAWGKLVSGTIKTICEDLSITVNDFVTTTVGMGVAALIAYKVAGKELLENALDIAVMVPLWFMVTAVNLFFVWYFFSAKTIYHIKYNDQGKKVEKKGERVQRYPWKTPNSDNEVPNKIIFAWVLGIVEFLLTALTLMIVLG